MSGWAKNAKKIMKFYLTVTEAGTLVRLTIEPTLLNLQDAVSWRSEAKRNWTELADELWLEFGIYGKSVLEEKWGNAHKIRALEKEKISAVNEVKRGTFLFVVLCVTLFSTLQAMPWLTQSNYGHRNNSRLLPPCYNLILIDVIWNLKICPTSFKNQKIKGI